MHLYRVLNRTVNHAIQGESLRKKAATFQTNVDPACAPFTCSKTKLFWWMLKTIGQLHEKR
jgi:hypothetical protein